MARLARLIGGNRDIPFLSLDRLGAATAGTGTDYEVGMLMVPDLTKTQIAALATGESGSLPINSLYLRDVILSCEAALTGAATNNFAWQVRQWRGGSVLGQYTLTSASSIAVGANTIAVSQAAFPNNPLQSVAVGDLIVISGGTGTAETALITAISQANGTITFTAVNTHSGAYTMVCNAICSVYYNAGGVTEAINTPHQLATKPNLLKSGDLVTFQRLSFGTGLASPSVSVQAEYVGVAGSASLPIPRG